MHTGPLPMSYVPDNDDCTAIACDGDVYTDAELATFEEVSALTGLTARESWELACWAARLDGDPSADRCAS